MCRETHNMYSYPESVLNSVNFTQLERAPVVYSGFQCESEPETGDEGPEWSCVSGRMCYLVSITCVVL